MTYNNQFYLNYLKFFCCIKIKFYVFNSIHPFKCLLEKISIGLVVMTKKKERMCKNQYNTVKAEKVVNSKFNFQMFVQGIC